MELTDNGGGGDYMCPLPLRALGKVHSEYYSIYHTLKDMEEGYNSKVSDLGAETLLDSETPKLKKLSDGLHGRAYEDIKAAVDKTGKMLLDGCSKEIQCKDVMGGQECYYTVKASPQDLVKNAEKYLK